MHPDQLFWVKDQAKKMAGAQGLDEAGWEQRLTQQLLYQNDSAYASLGNDPLAEAVLKNLARETSISMDARGTAAYTDHTRNTEYLNFTQGSYKLAGQTPSGGIEQADGSWLATKPGSVPVPSGYKTLTQFPVEGCTAPAGACTYVFAPGSDATFVRVPQADGSSQFYQASDEQQTSLSALQLKAAGQALLAMPGQAANAVTAVGREAMALGQDTFIKPIDSAAKAVSDFNNWMTAGGQAGPDPRAASALLGASAPTVYDSKTMQWLNNGNPLSITGSDITGAIFDASPAGLAITLAGGFSSTNPEDVTNATQAGAWAAVIAATGPLTKTGGRLLESFAANAEAKAAVGAAGGSAGKIPAAVEARNMPPEPAGVPKSAEAVPAGSSEAKLPAAEPGATPVKTADEAAPAATGCLAPPACFVAGTFIHTADGAKPVETFVGGERVFSRDEITQEPGLRPVIATKATEDQPVFEVVIADSLGRTETLHTTAEHPFWVVNVADDPADEARAPTPTRNGFVPLHWHPACN